MKKLLTIAILALSINAFTQVPSYLPTNGLVGYWPFNGNANDESGNGNNGQIIVGSQGTCTYANDRLGNPNSALFYYGSPVWNANGSYVLVPNSPSVKFNKSYTINLFINVSATNTIGELINKGPDNADAFVSRIVNGTLSYGPFSGMLGYNLINYIGSWHMITLTRDSASQNGNIYFDGSYVTNGIIAIPSVNNHDIWFGKHQFGSNSSTYPYQGYLDDIGIWNRVLTPCEIFQLYYGGSIPSPSATNTYTYCQNVTATQLTATGSNLLWYTVPTNGTGSSTAPTPYTAVAGITHYYVSQTIGTCESPRTDITVIVNETPSLPTATTSYTYCQNDTAVQLTATGSNLLWYTVPTNGTGNSTAPTPLTTTAGVYDYYVSQSVNSCESSRTHITVTVNPIPSAPTATTTYSYCVDATATQLSATGSNLLWYTVSSGGTGSSTTPTPVTSSQGIFDFYVSQTVNGCESQRTHITVNVYLIPTTPVISANGLVLSSDAAIGNQWYDQNGIIGGATNQSYTAIAEGDYHVIVTINDCSSAPSNTINVKFTGIHETKAGNLIKFYPNPVSNELIIEISGNKELTNFEIYNSIGQVVYTGNLLEKTTVKTDSFAAGVYIIKLANGKTFEFKKIIKE